MTSTSSQDDDQGTNALSFDEKVAEMIEKSKDLKISEMKLKLQSKGILTSTFCEKPEFVQAYAECMVKEQEKQGIKNNGLLQDDDDDDDDPENGSDGDDDDDFDDPEQQMPMEIQQRIGKLMEYDQERDTMMKQYLQERAQLESKYQSLVKPLYQKRYDVIQGKLDDDIQKEHENEKDEDEDDNNNDKKDKNDDGDTSKPTPKGIPQFWVCAMGRMPVIGELISEADVDVLDLLEDITCDDDDNGEGFTLTFQFAENQWFSNKTLTKRYEIPNLLLADEPILKTVEGCDIQWKSPEKCLTYKTVERKQRGTGKNAGQVRVITKKEKCESFFHFFTPPKLPGAMDDMDEERAEQLESAFNDDFDIAQALRSHVIPKAVQWFVGKVRFYVFFRVQFVVLHYLF